MDNIEKNKNNDNLVNKDNIHKKKIEITKNENKIYNDIANKEYIEKLKSQTEFQTRLGIMQRIEMYGFSAANKIHKFSTLGLVYFIGFNIIFLLYKYNNYWKERRVSNFSFS